MTDETVKVEIVGESKSAVDAMRRAADSVKAGVGDIKGHFETLAKTAESINAAFLAIGAIFAGGKVFAEAIAETKKIANESINLGRSLGISASEASGYATAIDEVGGTTGDFADASRGLTRQLKTSEKGLNDLGLVTRDAHGDLRNMRDLMLDAIETVNSYAEGTDRNLAAQIAFGRGANANSPVLRLTKEQMDEAAKSAAELGLVVGQQSVDAFLANRKATAEANDVMKGLSKAVGDALLPVLTALAKWFREIGPAAIVIVKGSMDGLVTLFWGLFTVVKIVWDAFVGMFNMITEPLKRLTETLFALVNGDWAGAKAAWDGFGKAMVKSYADAHEAIVADARNARDQIWALFSQQDPSKAPGEGKDLAKSAPERGHAGKRSPSYASKMFEEAYASMKQLVGVEETGIALKEKLGQLELGNKRELLKAKLDMGLVTAAQEIQGERDLENQSFSIEKQALNDRMKLVQNDEVGRAKVLAELSVLEQQHQNELTKLELKAIQERRKNWSTFFQGIDSGFKQVIAGFLQGTRTLAGLFKGVFDTILAAFANMAADIAMQWIKTHIMAKMWNTATAESAILGYAAQAGAAGVASFAAAPWPIDMGAPAFGLEMAAAAMSFAPMAAAAQGFDIPAGVNPVTQLHASEMVLPAKLSDRIRNLADGAGDGGGMRPAQFHINAIDGKSVERWLNNGGAKAIAKAMRGEYHRFAFT